MAKSITPEYLARSGTEHGEQMALFCWAAQNRERYPVLRWMFAIPNGGGRGMVQGTALKAEGVKAGVSDVCLPVPKWAPDKYGEYRPVYFGLFIEMKRADGKPSDVKPEQSEFIDFARKQGYRAEVAFGWKAAVQIIESYLGDNASDAEAKRTAG